MRGVLRGAAAVALVVGLTAPATAAGDAGWQVTAGGWVSGPVWYVATVPLEAGAGVSAVLHGRHLDVPTFRSYSIYDVTNAVEPVLLTTVSRGVQLFHEQPDTNGKILLLSADLGPLAHDRSAHHVRGCSAYAIDAPSTSTARAWSLRPGSRTAFGRSAWTSAPAGSVRSAGSFRPAAPPRIRSVRHRPVPRHRRHPARPAGGVTQGWARCRALLLLGESVKSGSSAVRARTSLMVTACPSAAHERLSQRGHDAIVRVFPFFSCICSSGGADRPQAGQVVFVTSIGLFSKISGCRAMPVVPLSMRVERGADAGRPPAPTLARAAA